MDINYEKNYLTKQLITYIGNKRSLLSFINEGINEIKLDSNKSFFSILDGFSGSGIVSRFFKEYIASELYVNDWEDYSVPINKCYLSNESEIDLTYLNSIIRDLNDKSLHIHKGIIFNNYSPKNESKISIDDRVFYTNQNAIIIDSIRFMIDRYEEIYRPYLLAPLLSEASIHVNTSGVFKGFYKNSITGIGQFGTKNNSCLNRIKGEIKLPFPIFSSREIPYTIFKDDIKNVIHQIPDIDIAYFDPPYNQHPYGSNYFMLNVITNNILPSHLSKVSGIPDNWKKSTYNKYKEAIISFNELIEKTPAKYILISYNNQGIIPIDELKNILSNYGSVRSIDKKYTSFKGGRTTKIKNSGLKEYLFILKKGEEWNTKLPQNIALF